MADLTTPTWDITTGVPPKTKWSAPEALWGLTPGRRVCRVSPKSWPAKPWTRAATAIRMAIAIADRLAGRGLDVITPAPADRAFVHQVIFDGHIRRCASTKRFGRWSQPERGNMRSTAATSAARRAAMEGSTACSAAAAAISG